MSKTIRPPVKIHGGKRYLASWIVSHFPDDYMKLTYGEPFAGAGSCLLNKMPSANEWLNDADEGMMAIWFALRDTPYQFMGRLNGIKYCEDAFNCALIAESSNLDGIELAVNEFVLRRMSRGGLKTAFAWSDRQRGGMPGDVNAFLTIIEQLPRISQRIQGVELYNAPAMKAIEHLNDANNLIYCDPPYLSTTRTSKNTYEHEMTEEDHIELAKALRSLKAKVALSGYPSPLYDDLFKDWRCETRLVANHSSQQKKKQHRQECLWLNY